MRINVLKTYKLYIGGAFPRTESGRSYSVQDKNGKWVANACLGSRKDIREAVVAARKAHSGWSGKTAYNRAQILYRIAEMLESRSSSFVDELIGLGWTKEHALKEVEVAVDRLVYYAGWADKYQQVFSTVNPVAAPYFNFSVMEPTGVVGIVAPEHSPLTGFVSVIAPVILSGNTAVVITSETSPVSALSLAEVLASSDVPAGVVNIISGKRAELIKPLSEHMDVNAFWLSDDLETWKTEVQLASVENVKRTCFSTVEDWTDEKGQSPYLITEFLETKTTWHPIGT